MNDPNGLQELLNILLNPITITAVILGGIGIGIQWYRDGRR